MGGDSPCITRIPVCAATVAGAGPYGALDGAAIHGVYMRWDRRWSVMASRLAGFTSDGTMSGRGRGYAWLECVHDGEVQGGVLGLAPFSPMA